MKKILLLVVSHALIGFAGFALGIYLLPILTAPEAPSVEQVKKTMSKTLYQGQFRRDLKDSDLFHWGEGKVMINKNTISLMGKLAPGPDYKLYLSPVFVETETDFAKHKASMVRVGDVKTFNNFIVPLSKNIDPSRYTTVIVWCESFGQFITAASYRK